MKSRFALLALGLLVVTSCNKRLKLVDADEDPASKATAAPPPTAAATTDEEDDPPVHMPHVPTATAKPTAAPAKPAPVAAAYPPTCAGACEKTLKCMGAFNAAEQAACIADCSKHTANPQKLAQLNAMDCVTLLSTLKGGGGGGASGGGAAPKPATACNADCYGCVWDGSQCYYLNGSMIGAGTVTCAACCCAKGGPAKRWE